MEKEELEENGNFNKESTSYYKIHNNNSKIGGRYFLILQELISKGYIIAERKDIYIYKTLMKWIPKIKSIVVGKKAIYYININKKDLGKIISEKFNLAMRR